jgi:hypothetical protein
MQPPDWLTIALGVLPPLPHTLTCLRDDGGQLELTLIEARDGELHAKLELLEARKGLSLTIPVEKAERGGYSVGCTITETYFLGGLESAATLTVDEVRRRKPYRLKERLAADSTATIRVIASRHRPAASVLTARVLDISSSGVGISTEMQVEIGDRFQIDTLIHNIHVLGEITAVQSSRMAFGRWRVGCQFTRLPLHTENLIDQLVQVPSSK